MRSTLRASLLFGAVALGLTPAAQASSQTGQIVAYVSDMTGVPVGGVNLVLTGSSMLGERTTASNEDGEARFRELPPGTDYKITVAHPGFRAVTTENIEVTVGRTASIDLLLEAPTTEAAEAYVVQGKVPMIDTESTTMGEVITSEVTERLPTGRDYQGIALMAPGVVDVTGGGNPEVHGSTLYGNQYLLDGVNITDPVTNTFSANFNFDAIDSTEVLTAGRDAEYGGATGGVINLVTKTGTNEYKLDVSAFFQSSAFQIKEAGEEGLENQNLHIGLNTSGPIIRDQLWYFVSTEVPWSMGTLPPPTETVFPDQEGRLHPARDFLAFYGLAKLEWQPTPSMSFKLLVQGDPTSVKNVTQEQTTHPDAETTQNQYGFLTAAYANFTLTPELMWRSKVAFHMNTLSIGPTSGNYELAGRENIDTGTDTVNSTEWLEDQRLRLEVDSVLAYTLDDLLGSHELKGGTQLAFTFNKVFQSMPGGGKYIDDGLNPTDPDSVSGKGLPYQFQEVIDPQDTLISGDIISFFVQDVWKPLPSLTIRPGVRFDSARMRNYQGVTQMELNTLSPRLGVSWDPFGDHKTSIRGGYYQYVDTGFLALSDFAGGRSRLLRTYEYNEITEQYDQFRLEEGGDGGVLGKNYLKDPWNQRRPRTHELAVGASRELIEDLMLGADFIYRFHENLWEDSEVNVQWNAEGDAVIGFNDGKQHFIYSLGAMRDAWIRYYGLEFKLSKRFSDNWYLLATYTWSTTEGTEPGIITVAFDRPRVRPYEFGPLPHDVRHVLKIQSFYEFPYGVVLGGRFSYVSGAPYNRKFFNSFYGDYEDFQAPRGFDRNADDELVPLRLPDRFTANLQVMWKLEELTGQQIDISVNISNLFNARTAVSVEERNLPDGGATKFGDVTDKQDPFNVEFGLRYRI